MITEAMPHINSTYNVVPIQFLTTQMTAAGLALIVVGISGLLYLIYLWFCEKEEPE